ncbi:aminotransferase class I/II-fold pyridoxal phosphate-dependent enzyme [Subsaximicrobium wynnwilliamsii]|uniref:Aminotransferase class I/II-fold pyridoxal phosphate-dependent enzyme n=1 Tax=Subsaximicrobium wynnwilliamsii TaxID=291179 RepID=A0A5C6ZDF5_9FLAO|nr:aminotransferase class I/II-fold pyridoxal phosphate-dependent enzyme [Subsaximicrobium wynnwilliamsii]TXD81531.1 aminotransferase class I/II-fold pyridoxal phosphate-dependent enzyme [Subsaximicrobium wynnwilliamsii]TXD87197.1 aminotransferase class I/II-fold pyridoxal phosphate-dependent enzyme [Subsaximicrobium wynnwilliamsii]TXE00891.1 aminotransferase class I/II-fold pyridoxal phosphate-dependent enzyme [Subsaximicrobium wynnwilliamsii]
MAKIKHNNFLDTVNDVFTDAIDEGVLHLYADGESFSGRTIGVNGKNLFHFGTTGYLGLEQDPRLKAAAISAIERFGTQFPLSKSYISNPLYRELEEKVTQMYNNPVVITKNSTLGHLGVIPSAVKDQDAIILDHQVHWSVQSAAKMLKTRSVPVDMVRHNDLNMLEDKIKSLSGTRKRIWYMADGIYSMFGDYAPIKDLKALSEKYPQLYLYFDDVHGMSWIGKNGTGYVMSEINELSENMLLFGTLSKTFGASGSVLVCSNKKLYREIKTFGGPLTFSAQLEPASVAAATASAKIHLTPEIYTLQNDLKERTQYFNKLLRETDLPLIDKNDSPVFFIGTGMPNTGYNFVNRLMKDGFYVNLGLFPAVPVKNTGVRITISRHNQYEEIKALVDAMVYHLPKAIEETNTSLNRVYQAFKLETKQKTALDSNNDLTIQLVDSISKIDKNIWNTLVGTCGVQDWDGLKFLEETFSNNKLEENNWKFWYVIINDNKNVPVLASFLCACLWKEDMLASVSASKTIEDERKTDPYYMTSKVLSLGCLFTEGDHLYINTKHALKQEALNLFLHSTEKLEVESNSKMIVLRDFDGNEDLHTYFQGRGFIRLQMPDACQIQLHPEESIEQYINNLSARNKRHFRNDILKHESELDVAIVQKLNGSQIKQAQNLYNNVRENNLGLNTFKYPAKLFENMSHHPNWEFIIINTLENNDRMIGIMFCYKNNNLTYVPSLIGLDYDYIKNHQTYRQLLYQTIKRAIQLNLRHIDLGLTASFEKRKLGANINEKFAYIQTSDNYGLELLGLLEG